MDAAKRENKPHFGSVVARMQGQTDPVIPAFVDLAPTMQHKPYNSPGPAMLGRTAAPVKVDGDEIAVMKNLAVTPDQLRDRRGLLEDIDAFRKTAGQTNGVPADTFHDRAFDVLLFWSLDRFSREGIFETLTSLKRLSPRSPAALRRPIRRG